MGKKELKDSVGCETAALENSGDKLRWEDAKEIVAGKNGKESSSSSSTSSSSDRLMSSPCEELTRDLDHCHSNCIIGKRNQIRVLQSATITGLFLFEGFEGISNDLTVNSVLFARGYICKDCYESNKKLLGVPTKPITSKEDVKAGDIIRFDYKNCFHEAIILEINHTEKYSMVCQISHYQLGYFPRHTVQEEDKTIPFDGSYSVLQYDRPEFETYSPEQVIERARRRRGEQDFQYYLNDAGHFVRSCKLKICSRYFLKPFSRVGSA